MMAGHGSDYSIASRSLSWNRIPQDGGERRAGDCAGSSSDDGRLMSRRGGGGSLDPRLPLVDPLQRLSEQIREQRADTIVDPGGRDLGQVGIVRTSHQGVSSCEAPWKELAEGQSRPLPPPPAPTSTRERYR